MVVDENSTTRTRARITEGNRALHREMRDMRHTTDYRLSSTTIVARSPIEKAGAWVVFGMLWVSALLGFAIVPGGGLLAGLMILAACGWVLWVLLWAAGSLIKHLVVAAAAVIGGRQAHEPARVSDSGRLSSTSFPQGDPARSGV